MELQNPPTVVYKHLPCPALPNLPHPITLPSTSTKTSNSSTHTNSNSPRTKMASASASATTTTDHLSEYITLISSDNFTFIIRRSAANISGAIKRMLDPANGFRESKEGICRFDNIKYVKRKKKKRIQSPANHPSRSYLPDYRIINNTDDWGCKVLSSWKKFASICITTKNINRVVVVGKMGVCRIWKFLRNCVWSC